MKKIYIVLTALILSSGFSSCLKDDVTLDPENTNNVIEFKNPEQSFTSPFGAVWAMYSKAFAVPTDPNAVTIYTVSVSYSGAEVAPQDITVNLGLNATAVAEYNTDRALTGTAAYTQMPTTLYTINSTSVVIKKGARVASFTIGVKPGLFDFSKSYALPLKITSASSGIISSNFGTILMNFAAKNDYDGIYTVVAGTVQRYGTPGYTTPTVGDALNGNMAGNSDVSLVTVGPVTNTVVGLRWAANASGIAGIDNTQSTVDKATNLVTMNAIGNATLSNIPASVNKYDPATKTFTINLQWNPAGSTTGNGRQIMGLILKYKGPR